MAFYLDTSALVKLVVAEADTAALTEHLASGGPALVACDLVRTELQRAVRRAAPDRMERAREVLATLTTTRLTPALCEIASRLDPPTMRSLDAIHLAAALDLGDDLTELITYDDRMAEGAGAYGIRVVAPS